MNIKHINKSPKRILVWWLKRFKCTIISDWTNGYEIVFKPFWTDLDLSKHPFSKWIDRNSNILIQLIKIRLWLKQYKMSVSIRQNMHLREVVSDYFNIQVSMRPFLPILISKMLSKSSYVVGEFPVPHSEMTVINISNLLPLSTLCNICHQHEVKDKKSFNFELVSVRPCPHAFECHFLTWKSLFFLSKVNLAEQKLSITRFQTFRASESPSFLIS